MAWVLKFDGQVYREADLTIGEAEDIEDVASTTWRQINPLRSAKHARSILQVLLESRAGLSADAARAKVRALKVDEFLEMLSAEDDNADMPAAYENGVPPVADGPSIPG